MSEPTGQLVAGKSFFAIMDGTGDTKVEWDRNNASEVEAARAQFDTLKKKGFAAFKLNENGEKGEKLFDFDPNAKKIVMVPPMVGG